MQQGRRGTELQVPTGGYGQLSPFLRRAVLRAFRYKQSRAERKIPVPCSERRRRGICFCRRCVLIFVVKYVIMNYTSVVLKQTLRSNLL